MKAHNYFIERTQGGITLRVCSKCGRTDFLERVEVEVEKGKPTVDSYDWVPVYERTKDGATVTPRECAGDSQPTESKESTSDRLQRKLEENRAKQNTPSSSNKRIV